MVASLIRLSLVLIAIQLVDASNVVAAPPKDAEAVAPGAAVARVDLNRASSAQLEQLPGISKAWARRIIANRPYHAIAELKKAGLAPPAIAQLRPLVTVAVYRPLPPATTNAVVPRLPPRLAANKVDLNTASLSQLQNLPGVEPGMAAHILAGRPYANFDDLARNGVPLNTIERIRPLVTVGP